MTQAFTTEQAISQGFTRQVAFEAGHNYLNVLVRPDVDFDDKFRCFCLDEHEFLSINGWMIGAIEEIDG